MTHVLSLTLRSCVVPSSRPVASIARHHHTSLAHTYSHHHATHHFSSQQYLPDPAGAAASLLFTSLHPRHSLSLLSLTLPYNGGYCPIIIKDEWAPNESIIAQFIFSRSSTCSYPESLTEHASRWMGLPRRKWTWDSIWWVYYKYCTYCCLCSGDFSFYWHLTDFSHKLRYLLSLFTTRWSLFAKFTLWQ